MLAFSEKRKPKYTGQLINFARAVAFISVLSNTRSTCASSCPRLRIVTGARDHRIHALLARASLGRFSTRKSGISLVRRKIENTAASSRKSIA